MTIRKYQTKEDLKISIEEIELLKAGFDLIPDHVVITDPWGNILYMNKAAEETTGYTFEEAVGKSPGDLWGGHMEPEIYEEMWNTIQVKKKSWVGEVNNHRKDGTPYWQETHINPVLDEQGNIRLFIGIEPDITIKKEAERFSTNKMEKFFNYVVGRELKMVELKKKLNKIIPEQDKQVTGE